MFALVSLVVCLSGAPAMCETVTPDYLHADTMQPPTFHECLGVGGQVIALRWLSEHPGYRVHRVRCSIGADPRHLPPQIENRRA
jgi:hypothetical protein